MRDLNIAASDGDVLRHFTLNLDYQAGQLWLADSWNEASLVEVEPRAMAGFDVAAFDVLGCVSGSKV